MHTSTVRRFIFSTLLSFLFASAAIAAPGVGDVAPQEVGKNRAGEQLVLSNYLGKAVVVSFWATWCPYCLKELPILEGIQKQAGDVHMQVIAINTESRDVYRNVAKKLSSLSLLVAHDATGKAAKAYGVDGIPHMVIIGRDGRIQRVYRGYSDSSLDAIVADINHALKLPEIAAVAAE